MTRINILPLLKMIITFLQGLLGPLSVPWLVRLTDACSVNVPQRSSSRLAPSGLMYWQQLFVLYLQPATARSDSLGSCVGELHESCWSCQGEGGQLSRARADRGRQWESGECRGWWAKLRQNRSYKTGRRKEIKAAIVMIANTLSIDSSSNRIKSLQCITA